MFRKISLKIAKKLHPYQVLEEKIKTLERTVSYYDVRMDAIYKSITHGNTEPAKPSSQSDSNRPRAIRGEGDLFAESDKNQIGQPSKAVLNYLNPSLNEESKGYLDVHWKRLYETLKRLELMANGDPIKQVLEIGPSDVYQNRLRKNFPEANFTYIGKPFISENISQGASGEFFDFDLEAGEWPIQGEFDLILCFEVIEHMFRDPMRLFFEVNRLLRPGGKMVLTTPNVASFKALRAILTHYAPFCYVKFSPEAPLYTTHRTEFTVRDIGKFASAAGFDFNIETFDSYSDLGSPLLKPILDECCLDVRLRGDTIYAVLTKNGAPVERFPAWFYV